MPFAFMAGECVFLRLGVSIVDEGRSVIKERNGTMKRKVGTILLCLLAAITAFGLTACGGNETKPVEIDAKKLAEDLHSKITYEDKLEIIAQEDVINLYDCKDVKIEECYVYVSSKATAEEIAVFRCTDKTEAEKMKTILETRVKDQKEAYVDYVPKEIVKLDKAVIQVKDAYAVLVVAEDDQAAKDIIGGYLK